jgi:hypothetical protein
VAVISSVGYAHLSRFTLQRSVIQQQDGVLRDRETIKNLIIESENATHHGLQMVFTPLDGLYNLSMTVVSTFSGESEINESQYIILKRISTHCALPETFPIAVVEFFQKYGVPESPYSLIDFLVLSDIPSKQWQSVFTCFRIAPKNQVLNLTRAKPKTLSQYFDISWSQASNLQKKIRDKTIKNKAGVVNYLEKIDRNRQFNGLVNLTKLSEQNTHKQLFVLMQDENFAYQESIMDNSGEWIDSKLRFSWTPGVSD